MTRKIFSIFNFKKSLFLISIITISILTAGCAITPQKNSFNIFLNNWLTFQEIRETTQNKTAEFQIAETAAIESFYTFYHSENYDNYKSLYSDESNNHFYNTIDKIKIALDNKNYDEINTLVLKVIRFERISYNKTSMYYYLLIICLFIILVIIFALLYITMNKYEKELTNTEELNIYSRFMIDGIESERKRISKDLHDTVLQDIKYVTLECTLLKGADEQDKTHKDNILNTSNHNIKAIRQICNNLTPPELAENLNPLKSSKSSGLVTALTNLTNQFTERTKIPCITKIQDNFTTKDLSINIINNIFRICQEAFNNIEKHAKANQTSLMLLMRKDGKSIIIYIKDDGCGFEPVKFDISSPHFGIRNIHERTKLIHGTVEIETALDEGTELRLEVPFEEPHNHKRG